MPAEEAYVLSPIDVRNIRAYVQHKYAAMPHEKRAEIVADAVNRIIHKQLPNFEDGLKRSITASLIRTAVLEQQRPVKADDIFSACLSLGHTTVGVYEPLHAWVEEQLRISCPKSVLHRLLNELSSDLDVEPVLSSDMNNSQWAQLRDLLKHESVTFLAEEDASNLAEVIKLPNSASIQVKRKQKSVVIMYSALSVCLVLATLFYGWSLNKPTLNKLQVPVVMKPVQPIKVAEDGLPSQFRYQPIDNEKLIRFLESRSSLLADKPYFDAIVGAAKDFDIHPILLFAITGQEQAFVPKTNKQSKKIANNPFNVFHSWKDYNTTIQESAEIASRTIVNLSKGRPKEVDPITWINRKYAEDPKWSEGVRSIFTMILNKIETK